MRNRSPGFSLIEMAVVLFIIVLVIGSALVPLSTQVEQRQINDTQKTLEEIKESLVGFALARGYLPCPDKSAGNTVGPNDTANDGIEDHTAGECKATNAGGTLVDIVEGNVPWATLGVANSDTWGNRFRYRVAPDLAKRTPLSTFSLSTSSTLEVCTTATCAPTSTRLTASGDGPVAVILSHGRNGYGAISANTGAQNPCPAGGCSTDELANSDGTITFVSRTATAVGAAVGEFDDIVTWLSKNILINRMVAAGKLP